MSETSHASSVPQSVRQSRKSIVKKITSGKWKGLPVLPKHFLYEGSAGDPNPMIKVRKKEPDLAKPLKVSTRKRLDEYDLAIVEGSRILQQEKTRADGYQRTRDERITVWEYWQRSLASFMSTNPSPVKIRHFVVRKPFAEYFRHELLDTITSEQIAGWIELRKKATYFRPRKNGKPGKVMQYQPGTIRNHCEQIRSWFQLATGKNKPLIENPWKGVKLPPQSERKRVLDEEKNQEFTRIYQSLREDARLAAVIVYYSGLRRQEFTYLRPWDVQGNQINVPKETAKYGKARPVPIHDEIVKALEALRKYRGLSADSTERYWPYHEKYLGTLIHRACKQAGIREKVTLHDLRRSFGTNMAEHLHISQVQAMLGHSENSTRVTVRHYTIAEEQRLKRKVLTELPAPVIPAGVSA